ncbi:MAG TPA: hypothetical protein VKQ36_11360, partial [Ktedonobacterales bacterium]|nr:hypothetical protein [Ktedonobacterales bacterium]
ILLSITTIILLTRLAREGLTRDERAAGRARPQSRDARARRQTDEKSVWSRRSGADPTGA